MRALHTAALGLGLALAAPATATELGGTLSLELANVANRDPGWDLFSDSDGMPSRGLRGGLRIGEHVAVQGGWHRVRRGATLVIPSSNVGVTGTEDFDGTEIRAAFFADEFSLGAQVGLPVAKFLYPYASADGILFRGVMKLDEDPETRKNPNQVRGTGLAPGVAVMGGLELRSPEAPVGWLVAGFFEAGYSWFQTVDFGELGVMKPGGLTLRGGVGVRF